MAATQINIKQIHPSSAATNDVLYYDGTNWALLSNAIVGSGSNGLVPFFINSRTLTTASAFTFSGGTLGSNSLDLKGTAGNGYIRLESQSSEPGSPTSGLTLFGTNDLLKWKGTSGFSRTLASTITASRTYTLPDRSGNVALEDSTSLNNLLPSQATNSGKVLTTNGTNTSWAFPITISGENYLSLTGSTLTANAVNLSGTNVTGILAAARFPALIGDVTNTAGTLSTTISNGVVTFAKMQNVNTGILLGRSTASIGSIEEIVIGSGLALSGGILSSTAGGGSVTSVNGSGGTTGLTVSGGPITGSGTLTLGGTLTIASGGTGQTTASAAFNALSPITTLGDIIYGSGTNTSARLAGNITTTKQFLSQTGTGTVSAIPSWSALTKADVGLANVENTALSTWSGSTNIMTLGAISSGTWNGGIIAPAFGGTGVNNSTRTLTINTNSGTIGFTNPSTTLTVANTASISGTNTGDQAITLSNHATGTWSAGNLPVTLSNNAVSNAILTDMAANSIKGNNTGVAGDPLDLTTAQVTAMINNFTSSLSGTVPASGGGTTNFLRADGTWSAPSGGGGASGIAGAVQFSGGSGVFSSDATNFSFNDTTNALTLAGGTGYNLIVNGAVNGIQVAPSGSLTSGYTGLAISGNNTASMSLTLNNTATSAVNANSRLAISTSTTGGDPYIVISAGDTSFVVGVDNDSTTDALSLGIGATPSGITQQGITIKNDGNIGTKTANPTYTLHTTGTDAIKLPVGTSAQRPTTTAGLLRFNSDLSDFEGYNGSTWMRLLSNLSGVSISTLLDATSSWAVNLYNYNQNWFWDTLTTQTGLSLTEGALLTTGTLLEVTSTSTSYNSTNGLLTVFNNSTATNGVLASFKANSTVGKGLYIMANGKIGIGTQSPSYALDIFDTDAIRLASGTTAQRPGTTVAGLLRMNTTTSFIEYHNGTAWVDLSILSRTGNSYGGNISLGTNDAFSTSLRTSGIDRLTLDLNGIATLTSTNSATAAVVDGLTLSTNSNTTPTTNYGYGIRIKGKSSTTNDRDLSSINSYWTNATDGSRTSAISINTAISGTLTEILRLGSKRLLYTGQLYNTLTTTSGTTSLTIDWDNGNAQVINVNGNLTITLNNPQSGAVYRILAKDSAGGIYTMTWPAAVKWAGGTAPVFSNTSKSYFITLFYDGTNYFASYPAEFS